MDFSGITSFQVQPGLIGETAAQMLLQLIREPETEKQDILLPSELVIRDSTRLRSYR